MQKKLRVVLFLSIFLLLSYINSSEVEIAGSKNAYAIAVAFNGEKFFATPSHTLLGAEVPRIKYDGNYYAISEYHLSALRDFALLKIHDTSLFEALTIIPLQLAGDNENFYFEFPLNQTQLINFKELKGQSGRLIKIDNTIGLFQGYLINKSENSHIYRAVTLKIFPNELRKVDFSTIKAEFLQKNLKNTN